MSEMLEREIAALPEMSIAQLRVKWRQRLKEAPPLHVRKQLFVPILAYKLVSIELNLTCPRQGAISSIARQLSQSNLRTAAFSCRVRRPGWTNMFERSRAFPAQDSMIKWIQHPRLSSFLAVKPGHLRFSGSLPEDDHSDRFV